jgi:CopG family nickel-responsive transcriptional regulator
MYMGTFNISLPDDLIQQINHVIKEKGYASRSEFIRDSIRKYLSDLEWEVTVGGDIFGSVTLLYSTQSKSTALEVKEVQHKHNSIIITTIHTHLPRHCLEILLTRGNAKEVRHLADHLKVIRGVENLQISAVKANE